MNRPNHLSPHLPYAIISYSHYLLLTDGTNDFERKLAMAVVFKWVHPLFTPLGPSDWKWHHN